MITGSIETAEEFRVIVGSDGYNRHPTSLRRDPNVRLGSNKYSTCEDLPKRPALRSGSSMPKSAAGRAVRIILA